MERESKKFLNNEGHHSIACILTRIKRNQGDESKGTVGTSVMFQMTDCSKQISLDFNINTQELRRNSIDKANLLIQELTEFRDALVDEAKFASQQQKLRLEGSIKQLVVKKDFGKLLEHEESTLKRDKKTLEALEHEEI